MKTRNRQEATNEPRKTLHKTPCASVEELIEEVWDDCRKSKNFSWLSKLRSDVLWETAAAVGCASGGLLTIGHPSLTLAVAGAIPILIQTLRFAAGFLCCHGLYKLFGRLFQ